jgi:general secretion pathway protein D
MLKLKNWFATVSLATLLALASATYLRAEPKLFDPEAIKKNSGEEKINLDFNDQEIVDVAKQIAVLLDKNIIIDPAVHGKITLISPKKVTIEEAYNAFLAAINMQGITVIESGKFLKIVKVESIKQNSAIDLGDVTISQDETYITKMINVKYIDAGQLKNAIASMVSKGNIEIYEPTNTLIITDTIKNIDRIKKVIENLDVEGFEERVEFIPLKYAPAKILAEKLSTLLNIGKGSSSGSRYSSGYSSSGGYSSKPASSTSYAEDRKKNISSIIADERTNSIIVKATEKGISEVQELVKKLDTDLTNDHNAIRPYFYRLEHTEAVKVSEVLNSILNDARAASKSKSSAAGSSASSSTSSYTSASYSRPYSSGEGNNAKIGGEEIKVTADEATNSLIIIATKSGYESILPVIQELDRQRKQINIAASIMEVLIGNTLSLGTSWNGGGVKGETTYFGGTNTNMGVTSAGMLNDPSALSGLKGLLLGTATGAVKIGGISIPAIGAVINASEGIDEAKIIQNPNITTLDNNEAVIEIGERIYFPSESITDSTNPTATKTTYDYKDVVLKLTIKPKVNHSNEVTMEIDQIIDDLAGESGSKDGRPPAIRTRKAKTIAMSKSAETIAIGGIISDHAVVMVDKVPILGDIPVVGWLFKNKTETKRKKNLIIFITPTVLEGSADIADLNNMTLERRQKFYKELGIEVDNWVAEDPNKRHSAGISIQYSQSSKASSKKAGKAAESYFRDSKEGVTNLESEGTSGKIR